MIRRKLLFFACLLALSAHAQQDVPQQYLDLSEDTTEVTTINDIIKMQQEVTSRNSNMKHFEDVWNRRSYININYNNSTLSPKESYPTGVSGINNGGITDFKSNWGVGIQIGRNYRLHKKAIANMVQFNIDYTYIDFNINHFEAESISNGLYDSREQYTENSSKYFYIPWNLQKYEASYGMSIGPSLTIAPFNLSNVQGLHYFKFNVYYHIGYGISAIYMPNKKEADLNPDKNSDEYEKMEDNLKMNWGHGLTNTFGFNISWKVIGFGYEHQATTKKYKAVTTKDFGDNKFEFSQNSNRIFIQFRM